MTGSEYAFLTRWWMQASALEVYDVIADGESLPRWWPSVYLDVRTLELGSELGTGRVTAVHTKGFLPYTLRWSFRVTEAVRPVRIALDAVGDFVGRGVWSFAENGGGTAIHLDWRLRAEKPLLRRLAFLLRPVFSANHRWAMARGEESLRLGLRRRRAGTEEERALIAAPPGPTFPSPGWWRPQRRSRR